MFSPWARPSAVRATARVGDPHPQGARAARTSGFARERRLSMTMTLRDLAWPQRPGAWPPGRRGSVAAWPPWPRGRLAAVAATTWWPPGRRGRNDLERGHNDRPNTSRMNARKSATFTPHIVEICPPTRAPWSFTRRTIRSFRAIDTHEEQATRTRRGAGAMTAISKDTRSRRISTGFDAQLVELRAPAVPRNASKPRTRPPDGRSSASTRRGFSARGSGRGSASRAHGAFGRARLSGVTD